MSIFGKWSGRDVAVDTDSGTPIDLLTSVQNERERIAGLVATLNGSSTIIPVLQGSVDEANARLSSLTERLDDFTGRIEALSRAAASIDSLENRLSLFEGSLERADAHATRTAHRFAEMDGQRQSLEQLVSLATDLLARVDAIKHDNAEVAKLENQVPIVRETYRQILNEHAALTGSVESLRSTTVALGDQAVAARQLSQDAQEKIQTAAGTIEELERRVAGLSELELKTRDTSAQLQSLNALAEHVASKIKALEHQQQTIEHALVESRKVTEMVWNMEAQIVKLNEGSAVTARVEETVHKLEQLQRDGVAELQEALSTRQKLSETFDTQRRDAMELVQSVQGHIDHLAVNRSEIETLSERVAMAQSTLDGVEQRIQQLSTIDTSVVALGDKVEQTSTRFGELLAEAQALEHKQAVLTPLEHRLDAADAAARNIASQIEGLAERRAELETLSARFAEYETIYGRASALVDTLRSDKQQLARFVEQTTNFMQEAASIAGKIDALKTSVDEAESIGLKVTNLTPKVQELAEHVERLTPRLQIIDHVQARLSELHQLSAEIDRKLAEQLSKQAQLDSVHIACDGLSARLADSQRALSAVAASQAKLATIPDQIAALEQDVRNTADRVQEVLRDEDSLMTQERRLTSLNDSTVGLASELADRVDLVRGLQAELANAGALKGQLSNELAQLQGMHRETLTATRDTEHHLQQLSARCQQIEERRAHVAQAERTVEAVERRISELDRASNAVDKKIDAIAARERIVDAVKLQVETIHAVAMKAQDDLTSVAAGHSQLANGREQVQQLLAELADLGAKTADIEARGAIVNDVRRKVDAVVCLLDDMRVTLDTVSEQKAIVDHVAEHLARFDDAIAEARGTTKALQAERKLAQRIVENVRTVHARAGREIRQTG